VSARPDGPTTRTLAADEADAAEAGVEAAPTGVSAEIQLDGMRAARIGLDEAIFAHGKSPRQLAQILRLAAAQGSPLLITRLSTDKHAPLAARWGARLDYCPVSSTAFFDPAAVRVPASDPSSVAIVAAGTSDAAVAREAARTLEFNGVSSALFIDVGVAGLWRLTRALPAIAAHPVVIAVAGMDAALPTVLGGLVGALIIAVPTSVGYGVAAGGRAALDAILASCSPGIPVMNIDNGYGAACAALRALRALRALGGAGVSAGAFVSAGAAEHQDSRNDSHRRSACSAVNSYPPRSPASAQPPV